MSFKFKCKLFFSFFLFSISLHSCKKLVQVSEPVNTITSAETFGTEATATAAVMGIYNDILTGHGGSGYYLSFGNGLTTINTGMSADELHIYYGPSPFETNTLTSTNFPGTSFWGGPYFDIYMANAAIAGLQSSTGITSATRYQLTGEARFLRAFCYFYLVNLFGDVPLATTTEYAQTDTLHRAPEIQVYQLMIADLKLAEQLLANDYSVSSGDRVRVNSSGASALLARVYLYQQKWDSAEAEATKVINNTGLYGLVTDLKAIFLAKSPETILEWQVSDTYYPWATPEANTIIPGYPDSPPSYYLTDSLLKAFEPDDQRKSAWTDSVILPDGTYYYPKKYKVMEGSRGNVTENYIVFRLAEQYLIRAEARAHQNNSDGAIADLNMIRERAILSDLPSDLTNEQILAAIMQERRIELFVEWGHRWLDLKRTEEADSVLSKIKPNWQSNDKLYPISDDELINNANLVQNPGY